MTTFYICRHGQTENNKAERLSGWIDTPLTDEGIQNALTAASKVVGVRFDRIISSDLGRAFITAYIIVRKNGLELQIERARGLREINYGELANAPFSKYPPLSPEENTAFVCPGGESLARMQERVLAYLTELAAANAGKTILLVGHDGTINAVRSKFTGEPIGITDLTHNAHDFIGMFTFDDGEVLAFQEVTG
jgi:probable phosphoglycerate mutase